MEWMLVVQDGDQWQAQDRNM